MLSFLFLGTTVMMHAATPTKKTVEKEVIVVKHKKAKLAHKVKKEAIKKIETSVKQ